MFGLGLSSKVVASLRHPKRGWRRRRSGFWKPLPREALRYSSSDSRGSAPGRILPSFALTSSMLAPFRCQATSGIDPLAPGEGGPGLPGQGRVVSTGGCGSHRGDCMAKGGRSCAQEVGFDHCRVYAHLFRGDLYRPLVYLLDRFRPEGDSRHEDQQPPSPRERRADRGCGSWDDAFPTRRTQWRRRLPRQAPCRRGASSLRECR